MIKIDVHQHLWSEPLVAALASRAQLPFIRRERGLTILHLAGERPYVIDMSEESPARRAWLVGDDGLDRAILCLSSPLGIEALPRPQARELIDAYHEGALAQEQPFGAWGAVALDEPDANDADSALDCGCVGISLPAGGLADLDAFSRLHPLLARIEERQAPLLVHPGPGPGSAGGSVSDEPSLCEPLWWPALTRYVAEMQRAWLRFVTVGRSEHPRLRVIFTMLAGLGPLHAERLCSRGGPSVSLTDPLLFYDTASYGCAAMRSVANVVGIEQILYGSDRPVVDPDTLNMPRELDWDAASDGTSRALVGPVEA
jgi:6-methylsalicylate decarboxylase